MWDQIYGPPKAYFNFSSSLYNSIFYININWIFHFVIDIVQEPEITETCEIRYEIEVAPLLTLYMDNPKSAAFIYFLVCAKFILNETQSRFSSVCKKHHFFIYSSAHTVVVFLREDYISINVLPIA